MSFRYRLNMMFIITIILVTIVMPLGAERSSKPCDPGWYYDSVISRCDTCDSICDHADIQGTVADCLHRCPGFISGSFKVSDSTRWPTASPSTVTEYESNHQTILALLIALTSACVVLVTVMCVVMCVIFRKHITLHQGTTDSHESHCSHDFESLRTEDSECVLLEGHNHGNPDQTLFQETKTETV